MYNKGEQKGREKMERQYRLNKTLEQIEPSRSVTLLARVRQMQAADPAVINLTGGEPDFDTPAGICEEAYRQLMAGNTHYGDSKGDPQLRQAIAQKLLSDNRAPYSPEDILITPGGKYAVNIALQAVLNPGDEVIYLTPGWVSYPAIVTLCKGIPVPVHLKRGNDFAITCEQLESAVTPRTRMLIINYPNNPTGRILTESDWEELKTFLRRHPDILLLSDEIYEKLIYDGRQHICPASDPEFFPRTLIVNGFSKSYAMTGWRIGYLACPAAIYGAVLKVFQHTISCVSGFIQKAALTALQFPEETERMRCAYERRRNIIYEGLSKIDRVTFDRPDGSFYAWVKFDTSMNSEELCEKILEKTGIGGIPGSAFGEEEECAIRFCYAADDASLKEFVKRLQSFCRNEL